MPEFAAYLAALMNLLVVLGMAFVLSRGFPTLRRRPPSQQTAIFSLAFAVMAVGSMWVSFPIAPGIVGDLRNAVIAIAAIVGGPIPAMVAAMTAVGYRVYLGGQVATAVIGIIIGAALSIAFSWTSRQKSARTLALFGVALACGNALLPVIASLLSGAPVAAALPIATTIFLAAVVVYPVSIVVVAGLLANEQRRADDEARLKAINIDLSLDAARLRREGLKVDLAGSLSRDEFEVEYQPIISVQRGTVKAFEALLRWRHPRYGMIQPNTFIPLAEEADLIGEIGAWVLHQACREAATWPETICVAVNVSPRQLHGPSLTLRVIEALNKSGLNPNRLELEITETVLLEPGGDDLQCLRDLHQLGVKVALDDFGTGYSSLSYLQRFPFDRIKIDRSFVHDVTFNDEAKAVIKAVVGLGHSLAIRITAEGVETAAQLDSIRAKGCDEAQGFLISRSVPATQLLSLIAELDARPDLRLVEPERLRDVA
jgi:EAL domain-containing protein (putative c-di-GMP-specific phosphodiesterase class I)